MIKKIIRNLTLPFFNLIYLLSIIIPKSNDKWIFGAWLGKNFSDNPKHLFIHVKQFHPEIEAIWITKNKKLLPELLALNYRAYYYLSLLGIYHLLTAKVFCFCVSKNDIFSPAMTFRSVKVNLWHGTPMKKVVYDDKFSAINSWYFKLKRRLFPFLNNYIDLLTASSEEVRQLYIPCFRLPEKNVVVTGYPRNDWFFGSALEKSRIEKNKVILYAPTHREEGRKAAVKKIFPTQEEWALLDNVLKSHDVVMHFRLHFYDRKFLPLNIESFSNIKADPNKDVQVSLLETDILITDYSGLFFDYLLLDRPIVFAPFDFDNYLKKDRELYHDYETITPGIKVYSWNELISALPKIINGGDQFSEKRQELNKRFNAFQGGSSGRVVNVVKGIIQQ